MGVDRTRIHEIIALAWRAARGEEVWQGMKTALLSKERLRAELSAVIRAVKEEI